MKMILALLLFFLPWHSKFKKSKALIKKVSKEITPIAWHPKRWWNFCLSEVILIAWHPKRNRKKFY